jgi:hypothetical protein
MPPSSDNNGAVSDPDWTHPTIAKQAERAVRIDCAARRDRRTGHVAAYGDGTAVRLGPTLPKATSKAQVACGGSCVTRDVFEPTERPVHIILK